MASAAPPEMPPASIQAKLRPEGKTAWLVEASVPTTISPPRFTIAVNRKAFACRVAYPPRKSLVPQVSTAAKLYAADVNGSGADMLDEGTMLHSVHAPHSSPSPYAPFFTSLGAT